MPDISRNQAVVLGASMAGSLAARVLAERFEQVVVIERDALPLAGEHRRGVRHGLHPRGREIPGGLFPGFTASLTASGAVRGDLLRDVRWQLSGHQLRQADIGLPGLFASRPFLEGHATSGRWFKRRCAWSTPTCHGCTPPLAAALVRVIGLKDRPEGLLRPDRMLRVLRGNLASKRPIAPPADPAPAATPAERPAQPAQ